ncbi:MAG: HAD-IIIA family hydrolase, partial [Gemmatimonadetes bacterium]|nr:HAD-IIIA family hydrolase [Gemmatimonadota bacterium]
TLNEDPGERLWVFEPEEFRAVPGAFGALARLTSAGWPMAVITNQSCVGRGKATREQVDRVNAHCVGLAEAAGARIDGVYVCPHAPDAGCECRKPLPGMLLEAAAAHDYDLFRSYVIGDSHRDLLAGRAAGATALLVLTGKGAAAQDRHPPHLTFPSVAEAVNWILSRARNPE